MIIAKHTSQFSFELIADTICVFLVVQPSMNLSDGAMGQKCDFLCDGLCAFAPLR